MIGGISPTLGMDWVDIIDKVRTVAPIALGMA